MIFLAATLLVGSDGATRPASGTPSRRLRTVWTYTAFLGPDRPVSWVRMSNVPPWDGIPLHRNRLGRALSATARPPLRFYLRTSKATYGVAQSQPSKSVAMEILTPVEPTGIQR